MHQIIQEYLFLPHSDIEARYDTRALDVLNLRVSCYWNLTGLVVVQILWADVVIDSWITTMFY